MPSRANEKKTPAVADNSASRPQKSTTPRPPSQAGRSIRITDIVVTLFLTLGLAYIVGYVSTRNPLWPIRNKPYRRFRWNVMKRLVTRRFTEQELAKYTGRQKEEGYDGIYLSIMGEVFDVSHGGRSYYGPGGSYEYFAGRDASRAYGTGCFDIYHLTHDLRGLPAKTVEKAQDWADFYRYHDTYVFKGYLDTIPIEVGKEEGIPPSGTCDNKAPLRSPHEMVPLKMKYKGVWTPETHKLEFGDAQEGELSPKKD